MDNKNNKKGQSKNLGGTMGGAVTVHYTTYGDSLSPCH